MIARRMSLQNTRVHLSKGDKIANIIVNRAKCFSLRVNIIGWNAKMREDSVLIVLKQMFHTTYIRHTYIFFIHRETDYR